MVADRLMRVFCLPRPGGGALEGEPSTPSPAAPSRPRRCLARGAEGAVPAAPSATFPQALLRTPLT